MKLSKLSRAFPTRENENNEIYKTSENTKECLRTYVPHCIEMQRLGIIIFFGVSKNTLYITKDEHVREIYKI